MTWVKENYEALLHGGIAIFLVVIAMFIGVLGIGVLNNLGWFFREQAQAPKEVWWHPMSWSLKKHLEWIVPSALGYIVCLGWYIAF